MPYGCDLYIHIYIYIYICIYKGPRSHIEKIQNRAALSKMTYITGYEKCVQWVMGDCSDEYLGAGTGLWGEY